MADIILKNRDGDNVNYDGVTVIQIPGVDENDQFFVNANPVDTTIQLDFKDGDMEVLPGDSELFNKVTIPTPPGLVPENIASGVTIAGVEGAMEGGSIGNKPIRFYNAYGEVVYGFTRAEIQGMDALPDGPALTGLTFDKWTHTLDELKNVTYFADVGPTYKYNGNRASVLIVDIDPSKLSMSLAVYIEINTGIGISWGDGNTETVAKVSSYTSKTLSHTYTKAGRFIISVWKTTTDDTFGFCFGYGSGSSSYNANGQSISNSSTNLYTAQVLDNIISVVQGSHYSMGFLKIAHSQTRLKFISLYARNAVGSRWLRNCFSLKTIAGKTPTSTVAYDYFTTCNLERHSGSKGASANAFTKCDSLKEVVFESGSIADTNMNSKWAMLMTSETPPSVTATSPQWGTYPIYVPDTAVDAYKSAAKWSSAAAYIFPASEYPDK